MKKKFLSILFALVLVASLSLVTAVPAGAATTFTRDGSTISVLSEHLCEPGAETEAAFDAEPETLVLDGVAFDAQTCSQVTIEGEVSDLTLGAGWVDTAYIEIGLRPEATMNDRNAGVYLIALNSPTDTQVHLQDYTGGGRSGGVISITKDADFRYRIRLETSGSIGGTANLEVWEGVALKGTATLPYGYASTWQENVAGAHDEDFSDAHLFYSIIADRRGVADQTYSATVGNITVDDTLYVGAGQQFATIQAAINFANPDDTINVAAGVYPEDVTVDKTLTLEGAQVGVDPRGGRAGDESEIVGVVVVTSAATDVVFDGFMFTSPTRTFNPRGFNLGVDSESSTIRNNILVAEENEGHGEYGSYLTFRDITNALVEQNSFSGHLDLIQRPNVIWFYGIAAGGVVTVQNNEMHDVGGGGGIGVMCGNADVVVNIDGNVIENTGNECIWVWNPGTSAFATLSITSNDLSEATLNGIKFDAPITGVVSVSGNEFWDNPVQVLDSAEILDIQDVLDNNTFDRAVVVRGSAIKVPTIFSLIQDAVNAAVTGDTVDVAKGTYDEVVLVNESVNLLGANAGVCAGVDPGARGPETVVDGTIRIAASDVVIDGIKLINGGTVLGAGVGIYMIDQSHITITNSILVGPVSPSRNAMILGSYGGTAETHSEDINVTCCESYNWNMGAYVNPGGGFSNDYLFQYNNFHDNTHCGLGLDVSGVSVLNNNFTDNEIGIESFRENVVVHFNNFCGNTVAIDNSGGPIDATNNWWCHASGPSHSPGYGDPVSGDVLYDPWLLEPLVPGAPLPTQFDKTLVLNIGWTLVSTDNWIDATETVGEGVILALNYTPSLGWFEVDPTALVPVNAIYLKMEEGGGLGITYSGGVPAASSKDLEAGWNLISSATLTNARAVLSPLRYIQVGDEQGVGLATLVSQGDYNQHSPSFYLATLGPGDWNFLGGIMLNPFDGYWVYMNDGKSFGVVPD